MLTKKISITFLFGAAACAVLAAFTFALVAGGIAAIDPNNGLLRLGSQVAGRATEIHPNGVQPGSQVAGGIAGVDPTDGHASNELAGGIAGVDPTDGRVGNQGASRAAGFDLNGYQPGSHPAAGRTGSNPGAPIEPAGGIAAIDPNN